MKLAHGHHAEFLVLKKEERLKKKKKKEERWSDAEGAFLTFTCILSASNRSFSCKNDWEI